VTSVELMRWKEKHDIDYKKDHANKQNTVMDDS
jgi:hypothetical protein